MEKELENKNVVSGLSLSNEDTPRNINMNLNSINSYKSVTDSIRTDPSILEPAYTNNINTNLQKALKMNDYLYDKDIGDTNSFDINSDVKDSNSIVPEDNTSNENQKPQDSKKHGKLNETVLPENIYHDNINEVGDKIHVYKQEEIKMSEIDFNDFRDVREENKELNPLDTSEIKTDMQRKYSEEVDSACVYDSKSNIVKTNLEDIDSTSYYVSKYDEGRNKSESLSESANYLSSVEDVSEKKKVDGSSKLIFGEMSTQSKEIEPFKIFTYDVKYGKDETINAVDLRNKESLDLDDILSLKSNQDHNFRKNNHQLCFNNINQKEEGTSELILKIPKKHFKNSFDYKKEKLESEFHKEDQETIYGSCRFKPRWIQKYTTPRVFLVLFTIIGVINNSYYFYFASISSTLEKRYAFQTKISGTLLLVEEVVPLVLGIFVGYIGGKLHRPRMIAICMFMSAICNFLSGLPYLIYGTSKHSSYLDEQYEREPNFCQSSINATHCNSNEQPQTLPVIGIFLLASFLKGFAELAFNVIGMSYMDDIIKRKNSPIYFAIVVALRLSGPFVGFLMASGFLKYYENPFDDPGYGPDDPRWIGAWWIGYFLQGMLLVIFAIPIALFPRRHPSQKKIKNVVAINSEDELKLSHTGLLLSLKRLGKNTVFTVLTIHKITFIFGRIGYLLMIPRYMENQFRVSASEASLVSGVPSIFLRIIATLLGGMLIWKLRPRVKVLLRGMIASEMILAIGLLILLIPRCQIQEMFNFGMDEDGLVLSNVCNKNCHCSTSSFTPFCGPDNKTLYFSPCYAGCTEEVTSSMSLKMSKEFRNCSCLIPEQLGATMTEGFCPDENCRSQMTIYLIIALSLMMISNIFTVVPTMILLRCIHPSEKSFALGTFETIYCLFGFIPFPVFYGALIDSVCLVWEKSCGEIGNCWFYDTDKYAYLLHGVPALFFLVSAVNFIVLYFLRSRVRNLYVEEEQEKGSKEVDVKLETVSESVTKL